MTKLIFVLFTMLATAGSFAQLNKGVTKRNGAFILPPGTIQVDSNLFFDQFEVTNFNWLEYLYYQLRTQGEDSEIYTNCIPDSEIWLRVDSSFHYFSEYYFRSPTFMNHPVVGISYQQAKDYSAWRSDRVFQYHLIKNKVIPFNPSSAKDSLFTIEMYFSGQYLNYKPDLKYSTYPKYELIDSTSFTILRHFADSVNQLQLESCKKDSLASVKLFSNYFAHLIKNNTALLSKKPTIAVDCECRIKKMIPHLFGNVSELTAHEGVIFGSGYGDSTTIKTTRHFTDEQLNTNLIGFRSKCTYRTWPQ